jgi:hypothetical protein
MTGFASRMFQTWLFGVGHGELLVRSPKGANHSTNIDLMFAGVEYMDLPRHLRQIEVHEPDETDISFIRERLPKQGSSDKIFVLISNDRRYRIVAAGMKVCENELGYFDNPFN